MSDPIDRQAAIDALDGEITVTGSANAEAVRGYVRLVADRLKRLPSVQPEIIRCKDCRWWDKYGDYDNGYCMAAKHGYWSEHWDISIRRTYKGDFYCADAEPKGEQ